MFSIKKKIIRNSNFSLFNEILYEIINSTFSTNNTFLCVRRDLKEIFLSMRLYENARKYVRWGELECQFDLYENE